MKQGLLNQQALLVPLGESLASFRFGPELRANFTNAVLNGYCFALFAADIRHDGSGLPQFDFEGFDKLLFLFRGL